MHKNIRPRCQSFSLLAASGFFLAAPAIAAPPMSVNDAGTLAQGDMQVEAALTYDHGEPGAGLVFGFSPIRHLEISVSRVRNAHGPGDPTPMAQGSGITFKWVPIQQDTGWSLGASFTYDSMRVHERAEDTRFAEKSYAWLGLASYRRENAHVLHLNLGSTRTESQGTHNRLGNWGIGYELPLRHNLQLTLETYGEERAKPDKAIGLRYQLAEGLRLSGAIGQGNDRSFGQIGFVREF